MKRLLPFLAALTAFGQTPSVTSVSFSDISHSVVSVHFGSSGWGNGFLRIRYIQSPGTCTSGTGGNVEATGFGPGVNEPTSDARQPLGGLVPNTFYQVCPEISNDNVNWSSGVGATVTTLPLPSVHPALPIPPAGFSTDYPDTSAYTQVTAASDGSDLLSKLQAALSNQCSQGTVINIPAGTVASGQFELSQDACDIVRFQPSSINTTTNVITIVNHGFIEGQGITFGTRYACLPGSNLDGNHCNTDGSGPIVPGQLYYACNVTTNSFQVCNRPISQGGAPFVFSNQGGLVFSFGASDFRVAKWPRPLYWIIVRTATPDGQFVPEHTRLQGPLVKGIPSAPTQWVSKMGILQRPNTYAGGANNNSLFVANDEDGGIMNMNANIRFVGIEFTHTPSPDAVGSNPVPHFEFVHTNPWNQNIIFDRCYFHALPPPDRVTRAFWWNGMNVAIVDSYIDNMQFYHPHYSGMGLTTLDANHFTIAPGAYNFGHGKITLPSTVTVTTSGTSSPARNGFVYFKSDGTLMVALPPGVSGVSCAGYSPCTTFTLYEGGLGKASNGMFDNSGAGSLHFPGDSNSAAAYYLVDPIVSSTSNCAGATSLFGYYPIAPDSLSGFVGTINLGVRFTSDNPAFVCGVRFYKNPADPGSTHTVALWNSSGTQLASATSSVEASSGWQAVNFSSPVAISSSTVYTASFLATAGEYIINFFINYQFDNGTLHAPGQYIGANGSWNYQDNFPKNWLGNSAVGQLGGLLYNSGGLVSVVNADVDSQQWDTEGCQCMVGGIGPGPYKFENNYVEATGTVWHHDDSGGNWATRADYTYKRDYFRAPISQMMGSPQSDGLRYAQRHPLEWKSGCRIFIGGSVFDTSWVEGTPYGDLIEFASLNGSCGGQDVDVQNNTFMHAGSLMLSPTTVTTNSWQKATPAMRFRFQNNLVWDINGATYCTYGFGFCSPAGGHGVLFGTSQSAEDWTINHNTVVANSGQQPSLMWMSETRDEGIDFTNNIFYITGGPQSNGIGPGNVCGLGGSDSQCFGAGTSCFNLANTSPKAVAECSLSSYLITGNLLTGTVDQGTMAGYYPNGSYANGTISNVIPSDPTNLSAVGWFRYAGATSTLNDFRLRSTSFYISGGSGHAGDAKDMGADIDALLAAQGAVTLIGVPNSSITSNSATVAFIAPDSQGCPVDASSSDPNVITSFTRFPDAGGSNRVRNVSLTGLLGGTAYYFRVNCAVQQPLGQFRTH
jgi:hypothetical protein